jgi:pyridoxal phosphate enzyme (YggS family)
VKHGINADYLLEINTSGEATKYGMQPLEAKAAAETLFGLPGITLRGLMTIASPDPAQAETEFRNLRLLLDAIKTQAPHPEELTELSMGMSGDFEAAIRQGATLVRVGTAIFGWR